MGICHSETWYLCILLWYIILLLLLLLFSMVKKVMDTHTFWIDDSLVLVYKEVHMCIQNLKIMRLQRPRESMKNTQYFWFRKICNGIRCGIHSGDYQRNCYTYTLSYSLHCYLLEEQLHIVLPSALSMMTISGILPHISLGSAVYLREWNWRVN